MGMDIGLNEYTLAIITTNKEMKSGGSAPVFYANDNKDLQNKAMLMAKSVGGMVPDMTNGTLIVVKH